ncbi:MAG: site-specific integrase [Planctomycetota bacterium]
MARIRFTKAAIERLAVPATGRAYTYDAATPGLTVCVTATGHRAFYLYKRVGGRPERIHIGAFPDLTVEQARKKADELKGDIARGVNPADRKRTARGMMTLGELFDAYLERAKLHKRTWAEDQRQFDCHLSGWMGRKLATITRADVSRLHAKIGKDAPYAANRALALLSCVFNTAANDFGYEGVNPCRGVKKFHEEKRDRFLLPDELKRFFGALSDEPDDLRDFFWIALLTGGRRGNCQSMCWGELDLPRGDWRIPGDKSKNREGMPVHLSPPAVEILNRRLTDNAAKPKEQRSEWVFPSFGATGHLISPKGAWERVRTAAGLPGLRMHDLRRTLASWEAITGTSLHVIGKSLGHRDPKTTAGYARLTQAPVSEAVDRAAVAMLTAGGILPATPDQGGHNGN